MESGSRALFAGAVSIVCLIYLILLRQTLSAPSSAHLLCIIGGAVLLLAAYFASN